MSSLLDVAPVVPVVRSVERFAPDRIVLLPLYPQFSTTTTETSVAALTAEAARQGLTVPFETLCCYPTAEGFIGPQSELIRSGDVNRVSVV